MRNEKWIRTMYGDDCSLELERHFANLARSCLELDEKIHFELMTARPDQERVNDLKRQLLALKGEMSGMGGEAPEFLSTLAGPEYRDQLQADPAVRLANPAASILASRCTIASNEASRQSPMVLPTNARPRIEVSRESTFRDRLADMVSRLVEAIHERRKQRGEGAAATGVPALGLDRV